MEDGVCFRSWFHWLVLDATVLHGAYTEGPIIAMITQ